MFNWLLFLNIISAVLYVIQLCVHFSERDILRLSVYTCMVLNTSLFCRYWSLSWCWNTVILECQSHKLIHIFSRKRYILLHYFIYSWTRKLECKLHFIFYWSSSLNRLDSVAHEIRWLESLHNLVLNFKFIV